MSLGFTGEGMLKHFPNFIGGDKTENFCHGFFRQRGVEKTNNEFICLLPSKKFVIRNNGIVLGDSGRLCFREAVNKPKKILTL